MSKPATRDDFKPGHDHRELARAALEAALGVRAAMWIITSGKYSADYRVHGIYTDKAEAEAAADLANRGRIDFEDEYRVEEVAVLDGIMPRRTEIISIIGRPLKEDAETEEHKADADGITR